MKSIALLVCGLLALIACSTSEKHAGSASVTTNGTVSGQITDSTGVPASDVSAILIQSDFDPAVENSGVLRSTLTDADGNYVFENVPTGNYRLLVRDPDATQAATVEDIRVDSAQEVLIPVVPLREFGSLRLRFEDYAYAEGDRFYLPGTDIELKVTTELAGASSLVVLQIPPGMYSQVYHVPAGMQIPVPLISEPIQIFSGKETLLVPDYEGITGIPVGFFTVGRQSDDALGGEGGETVDVRDVETLQDALEGDAPKVVRVVGWIQGKGQMIRVGSHKSILGVGDSAALDSLGFTIVRESNVVIRNLNFSRSSDDAISVEQSTYIWIDHNTFTRCTDGMIDIKRASDWVTVSWNYFQSQKLVTSVGHSDDNGAQDSTTLHVTYHHNWFEKSEGAAPRVRYGSVHLYNNVFDSIPSYAIASTQFAQVVVEANVFTAVKEPSRIQHSSPYPGDLSEDANLLVESGELVTKGITFDPRHFYGYSAQNASTVRSMVTSAAGAGKVKTLQ